ncbi:MAG: hypothetical protein CVV03_00120 [Firmicutes bacterium HGW-Firmicutes-8]|nr:MAG: hypothetical protein CVV03_00120 [Firmicutes bacterium HGW-Firmicutes-8]
MSAEKYCYITFPGVTHVLRAEKHLTQICEDFLIVPIPREISSDCGMCIMIKPEKKDKIIELLTQAGITYKSANTLIRHKPSFLKNLFKKT